jgi:hypothetical protein
MIVVIVNVIVNKSSNKTDEHERDKIRTEARGEPTEAFMWHSYSEH